MREFSNYEYVLMLRAMRILQFILAGRDSAKCKELAEYFESMARIINSEGQEEI